MTSKMYRPVALLSLVILLLVSSACGGAKTPVATQAPAATQANVEPTQPPAPTVAPTEAPTEAPAAEKPSGAISTITDAKKAIIQIESQGSFVDPQVGAITNGAGRGSGFIIDPSGLAVTNNHVVTGAALLKVWVGGDQNKTYNAKLLLFLNARTWH